MRYWVHYYTRYITGSTAADRQRPKKRMMQLHLADSWCSRPCVLLGSFVSTYHLFYKNKQRKRRTSLVASLGRLILLFRARNKDRHGNGFGYHRVSSFSTVCRSKDTDIRSRPTPNQVRTRVCTCPVVFKLGDIVSSSSSVCLCLSLGGPGQVTVTSHSTIFSCVCMIVRYLTYIQT
jgi:hypothetical protein